MSSQNDYLKAMENWVNIYMSRSLSDYFDYMKTTGISMHQVYALTFIYYKKTQNISDICEHMMVSAAAASQMVDRLEKQNLVERVADPDDRRVRNVVLTKQGEYFVRQSIEARQNWVKHIPAEISDDQLDQITSALQQLSIVYQN